MTLGGVMLRGVAARGCGCGFRVHGLRSEKRRKAAQFAWPRQASRQLGLHGWVSHAIFPWQCTFAKRMPCSPCRPCPACPSTTTRNPPQSHSNTDPPATVNSPRRSRVGSSSNSRYCRYIVSSERCGEWRMLPACSRLVMVILRRLELFFVLVLVAVLFRSHRQDHYFAVHYRRAGHPVLDAGSVLFCLCTTGSHARSQVVDRA